MGAVAWALGVQALVGAAVGCAPSARTDEGVDAAGPAPDAAFVREGSSFRAARTTSLAVHVADSADGVATLRTATLTATVRWVGAASTGARLEGATLRFADVFGPGSELRRVALPEGLEDFVRLPRPLPNPSLALRLSIGADVAGLRLVGSQLELVDGKGVPRLRVPPPWVEDADGRRHAAQLTVEGCAVDRSAGDPFGRPPTAPGASSCVVRVTWPTGLAHPLLVDPAWTTTGSLTTGRRAASTVLLASGRVLIAGGEGASSVVHSSAELYDPTSGTFASAGVMANPRAWAPAVRLAGGAAFVSGGVHDLSTANLDQDADLYDPGTGWSSAGTMTAKRARHTATLLPDGRVLLVGSGGDGGAGDFRSTAEIYTPGVGFAATGSMSTPRSSHLAALLPGGKVLVAGGSFDGGSGLSYLSTAEVWSAGAFTATGSLAAPRANAVGGVLPSGKVLLAFGRSSGGGWETTAELWDPTSGTFAATGSASEARMGSGAFLSDGRFLVTGSDSTLTVSSAEVYAPGAGTWSKISPSLQRRRFHSAVALATGSILIVGGDQGVAYPLPGEVFSTLATGTACVGAGECATGFCADGVCCDSACTGTCQSCTAALKASGSDGACGPTKSGVADGACAASGAGTCGLDGTCDGGGACRKWTSGTVCVTSSCAGTTQTNASLCDGAGTCVAKGTTACAAGYGCDGIVCATTCTTDANCASTHWCNTGACVPKKADGAACGGGNQCTSTFCADGVCCATKCDALCDACTKALKGSGVDGTCGPVPSGDLGRGLCKDTSYCAEGACKAKKGNGTAAAAGYECTSGIVADGVCCATACDGVCEACDLAGTAGTCAPVKGAPKHGACPAAGADPCSASSCDGAARKTCAAFAGPEVVCRAASCTGGVETAEAKCEGKGACPTLSTRPCDPLVCDGTQCRRTCRSDADCAPPNRCDEVTKSCVKGATCDGDHTVVSPTGATKDCAPLKCAGDRCLEGCASSGDCVAGFACDTPTKTCVALTSPATSDDGGGCTHSGTGSKGTGLFFALALLACRRRHTVGAPSDR